MLFGGDKVRAEIVRDALAYADEKGFQLIYGAMVGGCSKGVQYVDSDYDTRFLYLDRKEKRIFYPWQEKEETLKHRKYFDDTISPYEWIPLWEATSFFQFLKNPAFDGKQSSGLYDIVGWTMQSPYTWDPYGLSAKLMPLINAVFRKEYYMPYHVEQIHRFWTQEEQIITKNYIYAIYEALCILYADRYNAFPPVYMKTLAAMLLEDERMEDIFRMIRDAQKKAEEYCLANKAGKMHDSHFIGQIYREEKYDEIIKIALEKAKSIDTSQINDEMVDRQIARIYRVMEEAIFREQKVFRAED